jgi:hypothetical protein
VTENDISTPQPPRRKLAIGVGVALVSLLIVLIVIPLFFRGRIAASLKTEIDRSVNARVSWTSVGLSLLRDFPNVSLTVEGLTIVGVKPFDRDTLLALRRARLALELGSVVRYLTSDAKIVVREITLDRPVVRLRVLPDGRANWDIMKPSTTSDTSGAVGITLRDLRVSDANLSLDDQQSQLHTSLQGLGISLAGDFGVQRFELTTRAHADTVSVRFAGIPYLNRVRVDLNSDIDADLRAQRFTFARDTLRLNDLALAFGGAVTTSSPDLGIDLTFSTPRTAFHDILSLVPAIYAKDFQQIRTTGSMSVSGRVRGPYGPKAFPSLAIRARVENGAFQYPSLPLPARDITLQLAVDNPGGHVDKTVVNVERFHAVIGARPFDARLVMRTPVSDPDVDLGLNGSIDLADVARTVKLTDVRELAGVIAADVAMRARLSDIDANRFDRVDARGTLSVARVTLRSATLPQAIAIDSASLRLTPRTAELTSFSGTIGKSDVRATGSLDNLLAYALRDEDLRGSATVSSTTFDLNEWRSKDTTEAIPVPPHVEFGLKVSADRVLYGPLTLANLQGNLHVKDERVTLDELRWGMLKGTVIANGFYETTKPARPTFDLGLKLATLDIPSAFASLTTVQMLAPIARWAQGALSGTMTFRGALNQQMIPLFDAVSGQGDVESQNVALQGVPALAKLADALSIPSFRSPTLDALRASFAFANGRVAIKPFTVKMAGVDVGVSGSHGLDQSLKYDLSLGIPRALLGGSAGAAITKLVSQAGKAGLDISNAEAVQLKAQITGTITNPTVTVNFAGMAASAREAVETAVAQQVATQTAAVKAQADSAADEARRKATAEAERLIAEAEQQAATIRADARTLAATVRREGNERADSLLVRATSPAAKLAAKVVVDRVRREADQQAERGIREADARADSLVARAKRQADALIPPKG